MIIPEVGRHVTENVGHVVQGDGDGGPARCQQCSWQYPPADTVPGPVPTAMLTPDGEWSSSPATHELTDPGPEPTDPPETPPLTLKQRITNAVDRAFGEANWEPGDPLPDPDYMAEIIHAEVAAGADFTPPHENTRRTPSQALAYILDLPEWSRIERLETLMTEADAARRCFEMRHMEQLVLMRSLREGLNRYEDALVRIARLCSTVDQPESPHQNIIGGIAAEALVQR